MEACETPSWIKHLRHTLSWELHVFKLRVCLNALSGWNKRVSVIPPHTHRRYQWPWLWNLDAWISQKALNHQDFAFAASVSPTLTLDHSFTFVTQPQAGKVAKKQWPAHLASLQRPFGVASDALCLNCSAQVQSYWFLNVGFVLCASAVKWSVFGFFCFFFSFRSHRPLCSCSCCF